MSSKERSFIIASPRLFYPDGQLAATVRPPNPEPLEGRAPIPEPKIANLALTRAPARIERRLLLDVTVLPRRPIRPRRKAEHHGEHIKATSEQPAPKPDLAITRGPALPGCLLDALPIAQHGAGEAEALKDRGGA